jgi:hypothetical protein
VRASKGTSALPWPKSRARVRASVRVTSSGRGWKTSRRATQVAAPSAKSRVSTSPDITVPTTPGRMVSPSASLKRRRDLFTLWNCTTSRSVVMKR